MAENYEVVIPEKKEVLLNEFLQIERTEGIITTESVIAKAKSINSPLHEYFEWDDSEAARKYRKVQARLLINSVTVELQGRQTEAFVNATVSVEQVPTRGYFSMERVLSDDDLYAQVVAQAARELKYWNRKYGQLAELKDVVNYAKIQELPE